MERRLAVTDGGCSLVGLLGNVPVVVDKRTGSPCFARSRIPLDEQLR